MEKWGIVLLVGGVVCIIGLLWRASEPLREEVHCAQVEDHWDCARTYIVEFGKNLAQTCDRWEGYGVGWFPNQSHRLDLVLTRNGKQVFSLNIQESEDHPCLHGEGSFRFPSQVLRFKKHSKLGWKRFAAKLFTYLEQYERDMARFETSRVA